jgi:hypothetical protein
VNNIEEPAAARTLCMQLWASDAAVGSIESVLAEATSKELENEALELSRPQIRVSLCSVYLRLWKM